MSEDRPRTEPPLFSQIDVKSHIREVTGAGFHPGLPLIHALKQSSPLLEGQWIPVVMTLSGRVKQPAVSRQTIRNPASAINLIP